MNCQKKKLARFDWLSGGYAGIWLVFLIFPMSAVLSNPSAKPLDKCLTVLLLLLFCLIYLCAYGCNDVLPIKVQWQRTLGWCLLLGLPTLLLSLFSLGSWALYLATYFVAIWAFLEKPQVGIPVGVGITVLVAALMVCVFPGIFLAGGYGFLMGAVFVLAVAWLSNAAAHRQELRAELARAQIAEHIARDVHDILGHSLTVINLKAELTSALLIQNQREQALAELQDITHLSRTALAEVRATVTRLKTPSLAGELVAAARALHTSGITAHLPEKVMTGPNDVLFSWVLREAVTNVVRHSQASNCWVRLEADRIEIIDDGIGADIKQGEGLNGLSARVQDAGGELLIETGKGTRLLATMSGKSTPLGESNRGTY